MELGPLRRKKYSSNIKNPPLPVLTTRITGYFDNYWVIIKELEHAKNLMQMGCFGKANLSRSQPMFETPFVRKRVFNRRKQFQAISKSKSNKLLVVPDSESEDENYFTNLKVEYQLDSSYLRENVHLTLEEAFFLCNVVNCLDISISNNILKPEDAWELFKKTDNYFVHNYIVYHHFRSKNWVVKPGVKFGGDLLLYKEGPQVYHASYVVIIDVLDARTLQRKNDISRRSMEVSCVISLNRLCETIGKELLICQLLCPPESTQISPTSIDKFKINEVIVKRWISSQNRDTE